MSAATLGTAWAMDWIARATKVVSENRMPPWHADPAHGTFANDRRLTQDELDSIAAWVDGGTYAIASASPELVDSRKPNRSAQI